jgi:hypothetical protein
MRVAEVFDGRGPTGGIVINRPQVNPAELAALTAYLTKAPVALATTKTGEDEMSPGAGLVVPRAYHTDGEWIWPAAVGYYLHRYQLSPQTELVEHIRARGFQLAAVAEDRRQAAAAQMLEELAAAKRNAAGGGSAGGSGSGAGSRVGSAGTAGSAAGSGSSASGVTSGGSISPGSPGQSGSFGPSESPGRSGSLGSFGSSSSLSSPASSGSGFAPPPPAPAPSAAPVSFNPPLASPPSAPLVPAPSLDAKPEVREAEPGLWTPEPIGAPEPKVESAPEDVGDDAAEGETFSPAFTAAGNRHAAWVYEQVETFLDFMPVAEWSVDHETGRYRQAGREFRVDALGRLDQSGRWVWAWAEPEAWSQNPALTEQARLLREQGDRLGIRELTDPVLDLAGIADADDPETAAEMLAWTAMGVAGARGYIGHTFSDENRVYYLAFDESIPTAEPDLGTAAHYLTEGADKFEEDPSDCVLGYVEHHGWDWSRSVDGIVVSAGRLGTFTANLAADGALTGVSPNR